MILHQPYFLSNVPPYPYLFILSRVRRNTRYVYFDVWVDVIVQKVWKKQCIIYPLGVRGAWSVYCVRLLRSFKSAQFLNTFGTPGKSIATVLVAGGCRRHLVA